MFCLYCGSNLPEDAVFCNVCGRRQSRSTQSSLQMTNPILQEDSAFLAPIFPPPVQQGVAPSIQSLPQQGIAPFVSPQTDPGLSNPPSPQHDSGGSNFPPRFVDSQIAPNHQQNKETLRGREAVNKVHFSRRAVITGAIGGTALLVIGGIGLRSMILAKKSASVSHATAPSTPLGTTLLTYKGHSTGISTVDWSSDGTKIASGASDIHIWNAKTGNTLLVYKGHIGFLRSVKWSHSGMYVASGGGDDVGKDYTVQVWNAASGSLITRYTGHSSYVMGVSWSPNDQQLVSCSWDGTAQVWDANAGTTLVTYRGHSYVILCVAWSPNGQKIATADGEGYLRIWDAATGNTLLTYLGHTSQINGVAWSPDGKYLASVSGGNLTERGNGQPDSTLQVFDASSGDRVFSEVSGAWTVVWSSNSKRIATASDDVLIWDAATGKKLFSRSVGSCAVSWAPDSTRVVSGSKDNSVLIWQAT